MATDRITRAEAERLLELANEARWPLPSSSGSPERLLGLLDRLREDTGTLDVQGVRPHGDSGVTIVIDTGRHPEPLQLILDLEPDEPHRIARIEVLIGD